MNDEDELIESIVSEEEDLDDDLVSQTVC